MGYLKGEEAMKADIVDRLRGRVAVGPMMANGEPEFGYREFANPYTPNGKNPPVQLDAADEIEELRRHIRELSKADSLTNEERVAAWVTRVFGRPALMSVRERAMRILEEATELAQAAGVSWGEIDSITARTLERPLGNVREELADVANTATAMAVALGTSLSTELAVRMSMLEKMPIEPIRDKQRGQMVGRWLAGPLPDIAIPSEEG